MGVEDEGSVGDVAYGGDGSGGEAKDGWSGVVCGEDRNGWEGWRWWGREVERPQCVGGEFGADKAWEGG